MKVNQERPLYLGHGDWPAHEGDGVEEEDAGDVEHEVDQGDLYGGLRVDPSRRQRCQQAGCCCACT